MVIACKNPHIDLLIRDHASRGLILYMLSELEWENVKQAVLIFLQPVTDPRAPENEEETPERTTSPPKVNEASFRNRSVF